MIPVTINYSEGEKQFNKVINIYEMKDLNLLLDKISKEIKWVSTYKYYTIIDENGLEKQARYKVEYANYPSTFDIETSSFYNDIEGKYFFTNKEVKEILNGTMPVDLIKYYSVKVSYEQYLTEIENAISKTDKEVIKANYSDLFQQRACMYIWQQAFGLDDTVIIGRNWQEYFTLLKALKLRFNLSNNKRFIIYDYNLHYEQQWIKDRFLWNLKGYESLFSDKVCYYISTFMIEDNDKYMEFEGFEFKDLLILTGTKLEKINALMGPYKDKAHKLTGKLDYDLVRHSDTPLNNDELAYAIYDCIVCNWYIKNKMDEYGRIIDIPMTKTEETKRRVSDRVLYTNPNIKSKKDSKYIKYRNFIKGLKINFNQYQMIKRAYEGGFTHAAYKRARKVWLNCILSADISSSYGAICCMMRFPITAYVFKKYVKTLEDAYKYIYDDKYTCIFDAHFHNIRPRYDKIRDLDFEDVDNIISITKIEELTKYRDDIKTIYTAGVDRKHPDQSPLFNNNGRMIRAMDIYYTTNDVQFKNIVDFYDFEYVEFDNFQVAEADYLPKDLILAILDMYQTKTKYKPWDKQPDTEEGLMYLRSKTDISSIYGIMSQDPLKLSYTYTYENGYSEKQEESKLYKGNEEEFNNILASKLSDKLDKSTKSFTAYNFSHLVTAYARRQLFKLIIAAGDNFIYSDTDSVYFIKNEYTLNKIEEINKEVDDMMNACFKARGIPLNSHKAPVPNSDEVKSLGHFEIENKYNEETKDYIPYKRFCTCGAKRYLKEDDEGLHLTVAGLNKKSIKYLEETYGRENLFNKFVNSDIYVPEEETGKLIATYIDFPTEGVVIDYLGNESTFKEKSSVHLQHTDFNMHLTETYEKLTNEGRIWEAM